jgi:hypothetical protein
VVSLYALPAMHASRVIITAPAALGKSVENRYTGTAIEEGKHREVDRAKRRTVRGG